MSYVRLGRGNYRNFFQNMFCSLRNETRRQIHLFLFIHVRCCVSLLPNQAYHSGLTCSLGVDHSLWYTFPIKVRKLIQELNILQQHRAAWSHSEACVLNVDGQAMSGQNVGLPCLEQSTLRLQGIGCISAVSTLRCGPYLIAINILKAFLIYPDWRPPIQRVGLSGFLPRG